MLSSGSIGGPGVQPVLLCTDAIIANVFAGDAIFMRKCQNLFLQHISSPFRLRLFPWSSSPPIHPCCPIQLIFSQKKYESTKINLSCLRIRSVPSSRQNAGLYMLVTPPKPCQVLSFFFCLVSFPGRTLLCVCCQGSKPYMRGDVCAGILHVVGARICGDHLLFPGLCLPVFTAPHACCLLTTRKTDE